MKKEIQEKKEKKTKLFYSKIVWSIMLFLFCKNLPNIFVFIMLDNKDALPFIHAISTIATYAMGINLIFLCFGLIFHQLDFPYKKEKKDEALLLKQENHDPVTTWKIRKTTKVDVSNKSKLKEDFY